VEAGFSPASEVISRVPTLVFRKRPLRSSGPQLTPEHPEKSLGLSGALPNLSANRSFCGAASAAWPGVPGIEIGLSRWRSCSVPLRRNCGAGFRFQAHIRGQRKASEDSRRSRSFFAAHDVSPGISRAKEMASHFCNTEPKFPVFPAGPGRFFRGRAHRESDIQWVSQAL
jgi:hypothetical protein